MKARLINLISAVRTLMRSTCSLFAFPLARITDALAVVPLISVNLVIILYELFWGR